MEGRSAEWPWHNDFTSQGGLRRGIQMWGAERKGGQHVARRNEVRMQLYGWRPDRLWHDYGSGRKEVRRAVTTGVPQMAPGLPQHLTVGSTRASLRMANPMDREFLLRRMGRINAANGAPVKSTR